MVNNRLAFKAMTAYIQLIIFSNFNQFGPAFLGDLLYCQASLSSG